MSWDTIENWERTNAINQNVQSFGQPFDFSRPLADDVEDVEGDDSNGFVGSFAFTPLNDSEMFPGACHYDGDESKLKYIWLYFGRTLLGDGGEQAITIENGRFLYAEIDHSYAGQPTLTFGVAQSVPTSDLVTTYRALWYRDSNGNLIDMRCAPQIPAYL